MAAGAQSSKNQKNSLADRKQRAAGRDPERERVKPVAGAFGKEGRPVNRRGSTYPGQGAGGGGGTVSKSDYTAVGTSKRKARKRKA